MEYYVDKGEEKVLNMLVEKFYGSIKNGIRWNE